MLLKKHIQNQVRIHSDEWHGGRLGKFTASEIYNLVWDKAPTEGALKYVYRKVGEDVSGIAARDEISVPATNHGLLYEPEAIKLFGEKKGVEFVVTQCLVCDPESRFGCTPDAIIPIKESEDKLSYIVHTAEIKCPLDYGAYIELFRCNTPQDIRRVSKMYFYQVLDQMYNCGALTGYLVVYNPFFKFGQMKIIEFKKIDLVPEFKLLAQRKQWALEEFEKVREELLTA